MWTPLPRISRKPCLRVPGVRRSSGATGLERSVIYACGVDEVGGGPSSVADGEKCFTNICVNRETFIIYHVLFLVLVHRLYYRTPVQQLCNELCP